MEIFSQAWRVARFATVDSTNSEARRAAEAGDPGRLWVVAEEQTAGSGRRGRSWASPRGNLHASALLIDPCPSALAPQLGFVAGLALARAAQDAGAADFGVKWPNDLVSRGGKCAGLLVEGAKLADGRVACIVGIGVNCAQAPEGFPYPTARLVRRDGEPIQADALLERLVERFDEALRQWDRGREFGLVRSAWLNRAVGVGGEVTIESGARRRKGVFEGIDNGGRLLFRSDAGVENVEAADLWLPPGSGPPAPAGSTAVRFQEGRV